MSTLGLAVYDASSLIYWWLKSISSLLYWSAIIRFYYWKFAEGHKYLCWVLNAIVNPHLHWYRRILRIYYSS